MKKVLAALYILTGLSLIFLDLVLTGAMLGMTYPIFSTRSMLMSACLSLAPALLILAGVATVAKSSALLRWLVAAAIAIIALLAIWTTPRIGWLYAVMLFLAPYAIAFAMGVVLTRLSKRAWLMVLLGGLIATPVVYMGALGVKDILFGPTLLVPRELVIFVPAILVFVSLICALRFRMA